MNSICALLLRSSSLAHRAIASYTTGSSLNRTLLRSTTGVPDRQWYSDPVLTTGWVAWSLHSTTSRLDTIAALRS